MVSAESARRFQIVAAGNNTNTTVTGTLPEYLTVHNLSLSSGNFISDGNQREASVGRRFWAPRLQPDLFGEEDPLGKTIRINKINFNVIGVLVKREESAFLDRMT